MEKNFTKMILAGMAMLTCLSGEVNAQKKWCLSQIDTQLEENRTYCGYDDQGRPDSIYIYVGYYDEEIYRLIDYDDKGNIISEGGHCVLPGDTKYTKTYIINYSYDENNRLVSRINYNLDTWTGTGEYLLGGVYKYSYDNKGRMVQRKLYWDENCTDLFEETDYIYNEKDLKIKEVFNRMDFSGSLYEETIIFYEYDDKDRLIHTRTDVLNHQKGVMEEYCNVAYKYDANGNLTNRINYGTNPENPNEEHRLIYYTDTLASDVAMPINLEDDMDFFTRSTNVVKQDSIYRLDAEGQVFSLFGVQDWTYTELGSHSGIGNVYDNSRLVAVSRDADGNLILNGVDRNENIRIYDANGKLISNGAYNGKVNLSGLPRGMYIVTTRNGSVKVCR